MQIKVFHINLSKDELVTGQSNNYWSILIFYDNEKSEKTTDKVTVTEESELADV